MPLHEDPDDAGAYVVRQLLRAPGTCDRCDLLVGLPGLHVIKVVEGADRLTVTVESPPAPAGCWCGVIATSGGRRTVVLVDAPCSVGRFGCCGGNGPGGAAKLSVPADRSPSKTSGSAGRGAC